MSTRKSRNIKVRIREQTYCVPGCNGQTYSSKVSEMSEECLAKVAQSGGLVLTANLLIQRETGAQLRLLR